MSSKNESEAKSPTTPTSPVPTNNSNNNNSTQYPHCYLNNQNFYQNNWMPHPAQSYHQYYQNFHYYQQFNPHVQFPNMINNMNNFNIPQSNYQNRSGSGNFQNRNKNPNHFKNYNNNTNNNQFKNHNNNFHNRNHQNNTNSNLQQHNNSNNNRNFNKNNNNRKNKNKQKIDKRDLPENNQFYCEVCDRGFKTQDKYKEHCDTHKTCGINGCKFTAAEKLVEIHYRNFHATGLDKKVSNLQTQEEIQKYINERKKNFPTATNAEKKLKLEDEKEARGVRLNTQQFGKLKAYTNTFRNKPDDDKENNKNNNNNNLDDSNKSKSNLNQRLKSKRKQLKKKKNKKSLFDRKAEILKNKYAKPTLLKRLLADEIRHERNILLQCVKYVVENNFFDKSKILLESQQKNSHESQDIVIDEGKEISDLPDTTAKSNRI